MLTTSRRLADGREIIYFDADGSWAQAPVHTGRADCWLHLQLFSLRRPRTS